MMKSNLVYVYVALAILAVVVIDYVRWAKAGPKTEKLFSRESLSYYWRWGFLFHRRVYETYNVVIPQSLINAQIAAQQTYPVSGTITVTNDKIVIRDVVKFKNDPERTTERTIKLDAQNMYSEDSVMKGIVYAGGPIEEYTQNYEVDFSDKKINSSLNSYGQLSGGSFDITKVE